MGREEKGTCQPQTPAHIHLAPACGICLQILQNATLWSGGEWGADVYIRMLPAPDCLPFGVRGAGLKRG